MAATTPASHRYVVTSPAATGSPKRLGEVSLELWSDVANVAELLSAVRQGVLKPSNLVLMDAGMLLDHIHLQAAVQRALHTFTYGKPRTRNIGSEIIYSLHPGSSVAKAFTVFGLTEKTSTVLALCVTKYDEPDGRAFEEEEDSSKAAGLVIPSLSLPVSPPINGKNMPPLQSLTAFSRLEDIARVYGLSLEHYGVLSETVRKSTDCFDRRKLRLDILEALAVKGHL